MWFWRAITLHLVALLLTTIGLDRSGAAEDFSAGNAQRWDYRIAWNGIPAAAATIEVLSERYGDESAYIVSAHASTNSFVDLFWRFRGDARTTLIGSTLRPLSFRFERGANSTSEVTWIDFDDRLGLARSVYIKRARRKDLTADARVVVDPITAAFRALSANVGVGDALRYDIFTGESHYEAVLRVVGQDRIQVPAGEFDALRVEPEVFKVGGDRRPDNRLHKASIWVTRTPIRAILRIRSQVLIGSVTLDLVHGETVQPTMNP